MGRRRKLAEIDRLEGNPSRRPALAGGVAGLGTPFVPEHLMPDAVGCIEIIKASMPPNVYCALDSFALSAFAMAWAVHKRAAFEISNPDFQWIETLESGSRVPSPWLRIMNAQVPLLASLGDRLGLDPKSRQALALPARKPESKFAGLLGREGAASNFSRKN